MKRFIALLRGINISGKNKIAMPELKNCFEGLLFTEVKTYLNSGNVIFSSNEEDINTQRPESQSARHTQRRDLRHDNIRAVHCNAGRAICHSCGV